MSRKSKCTVIEIERLQSGLCTPGSPAGGVGERGVQMGGAAGRGTARLWTLKSEDPSSACPPTPRLWELLIVDSGETERQSTEPHFVDA